jgi:hypothetical protein
MGTGLRIGGNDDLKLSFVRFRIEREARASAHTFGGHGSNFPRE